MRSSEQALLERIVGQQFHTAVVAHIHLLFQLDALAAIFMAVWSIVATERAAPTELLAED